MVLQLHMQCRTGQLWTSWRAEQQLDGIVAPHMLDGAALVEVAVAI